MPNDNILVSNIFDINIGDIVVHRTHGVCRYVGTKELTTFDVKKEYITLQFKDNDTLYVPIDQINLLSKYLGAGTIRPQFNKLGTSDWKKRKVKAKESCEKMADELISLYAKRQNSKGISFNFNNNWQEEFENSFPYEETEDQIRCINEVKIDMSNPIPMERLLCGDVGYGKTEVAMRAAFGTVMSGYQVAYLAPTTILTSQHYNKFIERMAAFKIKIEMLSRLKDNISQKQIVKDLKNGKIDIIIGTHRLVQPDIDFKKLGLLIIDEEHRFGVSHKEKIKEMYPNIDILMISATPIPRTLYVAMSGIKSLSVLNSPPKLRKPVKTHVIEYDEEIIKNAILKEIERNGQIFYVYNNIENIQRKFMDILKLVPEARIGIAHGQEDEREIEKVMLKLANGDIDVLLCTTIIETGIDYPNVNTIIVENADAMGLSQLYQLRGRVGRSTKKAYAYLTFKKNKQVGEIAEKRLEAIKENSNLGAGFKIAMKDLELRGVGNILGRSQHGHVNTVGYEMYQQLLVEAISKLRGNEESIPETLVEIPIKTMIPENYIKSHVSRLEFYKKIAIMKNDEEFKKILNEMELMFGRVPFEVKQLITLTKLKRTAARLNITEISGNRHEISFYFSKDHLINLESLTKLIQIHGNSIKIVDSKRPCFRYKIMNEGDFDEVEYLDKIETIFHELS